jgi:flagellar hook-associated protein 2
MAVESIAKTLGTGSGIDISALVDSLVENAFTNQNQQIAAKTEALTSQISQVGTLKSNISDFASALASLTSGGSLATQPTSSNSGILTVTRLPGGNLAGLTATMEVRQLAQGQVSSSQIFGDGSGTVLSTSTGTLTLSFGTADVTDGAMSNFVKGKADPVAIAIPANATLKTIADTINAKGAGVTASILNDSSGARLVLKSATGASQAFTLSGTGGLSALNVGGGAPATINATAQDARIALDGVEAKYPTNSISNMIPGARIDLVAAQLGTKVSIGASAPTSAISQAVSDFVTTYNEVLKAAQAAVDPATGPLRSDPAAKELVRQLKQMSLTQLVSGAADTVPSRLADIGVKTNRDGTLSIDSSRLSKVLSAYPNDVEKMFAESAGLSKALSTIATAATSTKTGLGASADNYSKQQTKLEDAKEKLESDTDKMRTRLTQQFSAMDAKVAAYKSTQSFLTQQIAAWNAG